MRHKWAMAIVAACVVVTVAAVAYAVGKASSVPEVIRARRFEVVDAEGSVRASVGLADWATDFGALGPGDVVPAAHVEGPGLRLFDRKGRPRAVLGLSDMHIEVMDGDPTLCLLDSNGRERASLEDNRAGVSLHLKDPQGRTRVMLLEWARGPELQLYDENGEVRAELSLPDDGRPGLALADERGEVIWQAP